MGSAGRGSNGGGEQCRQDLDIRDRLRHGEDVGWERHAHVDLFLRLEQGAARLDLGSTEDAVEESHELAEDWALIIPAGIWHIVVNMGTDDLRLYSLYSPPEHAPGTIHVTRADDPENRAPAA